MNSLLSILQRARTIFASQIEEEVLKYSRLKRRLVVVRGLLAYSVTQLRILSYVLAAFSGIDLPDRISSPVIGFKSIWGVFDVGSMNRVLSSTIKLYYFESI